jgi:hypothetical protein
MTDEKNDRHLDAGDLRVEKQVADPDDGGNARPACHYFQKHGERHRGKIDDPERQHEKGHQNDGPEDAAASSAATVHAALGASAGTGGVATSADVGGVEGGVHLLEGVGPSPNSTKAAS